MATAKPETDTSALRCVCTSNLPDILGELNISLVVSTYQAGKVILVRSDNGTINTHFRNFQKPIYTFLSRTTGTTARYTSLPQGESTSPNGLPVISSEIAIEGNGSTIERGTGSPNFRGLVANVTNQDNSLFYSTRRNL